MAKHMVKCLYCGKMFDANTESYVKPNERRYAHTACANGIEAAKTQEEKDREELENYIKQLFGIKSISVKIKKQIEKYHQENNYSYSGIKKSLIYFFEIRGNSLEKANGGIGIVPYVYADAFTYYRAIWEAQQQNKDIQLSEYILPTREIHIESPKRETMGRRKNSFAFLEDET